MPEKIDQINKLIKALPLPKKGLYKLKDNINLDDYIAILQSKRENKTYTIDASELGGSGTGIQSLTAGDNITIDDTDPLNPIVSASGGGGSPAGSDTWIQYNNAGSFGASSDFTFDPANSDFVSTTNNSKLLNADNIFFGILPFTGSYAEYTDTNDYINFSGIAGQSDMANSKSTFFGLLDNTNGYQGMITTSAKKTLGHITTNILNYDSNGYGTELVLTTNTANSSWFSKNTATSSDQFELGIDSLQMNHVNNVTGDTSILQIADGTLNVKLPQTQQSAVSFTGSGLDDLTVAGTFSGTVPTTYTVTVASTGTPDTFDWTDGTNTGTGVSMSTSPISLSNGISISFGADTGHTLTDSWTWTYSNVQNNILDFSNGTYKFGTDFGTNYFGYEVGKNILGFGIKGAVNTYTNTGGDFGLLGFVSFDGTLGSTNQLFFSGGETASTYLAKNQYDIEVGNGTDKFLQSITPVTFSYINIIGGIEYGIEQSAGVVTIGNRTGGGNNTKITVDDVNEHITISNLPAYDDDTAAGVAGLTAGMVYMTTGSGSAPLNAAGILMIKQ